MQDLADHPFAIHMAAESRSSPTERAWERFWAKCEKLLGHSLDGNDDTDGYSIDGAYAAFDAGATAEQYVAEVREAIWNHAAPSAAVR